MSQKDIERFVSDLKEKPALLAEVKSGAMGLSAVVELAQAKGYDISVDEAKAYIREQAGQELSDDQLDAVAGGKGHHHHGGGSKAVEAVTTVTTAATTAEVAAEVVSLAVEAAEVATTVAAAAEVAVVLT